MAAAAADDGTEKEHGKLKRSCSPAMCGASLQSILLASSVVVLLAWILSCFQPVRVFWASLTSEGGIDSLAAHRSDAAFKRRDFTKGSLVQALDVERRVGKTGEVSATKTKGITVDFGTEPGVDLVKALKPEQLLLIRQGGEYARMPQWFPAPQRERQEGKATTVKRIVAFGDSLTAGFHRGGSRFSPYGPALSKALLPEVVADVWVNGMSAALALEMLSQMDWTETVDAVERLGVGMRRLLKDKGPIDLLVILAGTNDMGHRMAPERIADSVTKLHEASHKMGVSTVMLSIPPSAYVAHNRQAAEYWRETNGLLHAWAKKQPIVKSGKAGLARYVNTSELMPYSATGGLYDRDGLHFTVAGSKRLGEKLGEILKDILL